MNNFDANNRTKWLTFEEAKQKLGDPLSSLVLFRCKRHMVLAPRYIGKVNKGIRETLDSELRLFCPKLSAVLVAYHNVSVVQSTGDIHDEEPFLHFDIEADFLVFRPNVGCTLKGVVNKVGKDHIGCLVHSCFNASVPKPRGNTAHEGEITVGDELEFEVTAFYNNNRILSLRGLLKPGSIRKGKTTSSAINGGEVTVESPDFQSTPLEPSRKRKREKTLGISGEGEINLSQEIITDSGSRKKKKKKIKDSSDSQNENQNSSSSFDYESNHSQKMKKKKIKLEAEDENDNQNESFTYPSTSIHHYELKKSPKKKKKKSDKNEDQVSIESKASTPSFLDSGVDISLRESETTVSPKKKKKRKIKEEPVDNYDSSVSPSPLKKHKKHKKKIKQEPM